MLTEADRQIMAETGMIPKDRMHALQHALTSLASDARTAARDHADPKSHAAAALRGKALAYNEAALMVRHIAAGRALHPRRYSTARRLAQAWGERRANRRASSEVGGL